MTAEAWVWMRGDPVPAIGSYRGEAGRLVQALKFSGNRSAVAGSRVGLAGLALAAGTLPDAVSRVPTTMDRRGRRGVDQTWLLAIATVRALRGIGGGSAVLVRRLLLRAPRLG